MDIVFAALAGIGFNGINAIGNENGCCIVTDEDIVTIVAQKCMGRIVLDINIVHAVPTKGDVIACVGRDNIITTGVIVRGCNRREDCKVIKGSLSIVT